MRSVHSVLNLTPPRLLKELILVDDGSTSEHIRPSGTGELENYVKLLPKVKLVRNKKRTGIVGARMKGINESIGPTFIVLDSHIEVQPRWIEPIVFRIQEDKTRVVMPTIDTTDSTNFEFLGAGIGCQLGFLWKLIEHALEPQQEARMTAARRGNHPTDILQSPTMAGGLFAADKDFFLKIGAYDEGMHYWGTENVEFSFRLWMCGGTLECAPCSRVYHIFRKGGSGFDSPDDSVTINKMRTLLWMDEYADLAWYHHASRMLTKLESVVVTSTSSIEL
eukprot:GHVQ01001946.1.p1 GENE.GHVQ01001946.1~~GHVQ01001946.1.p1  ORF type:complete len:278 (+),score=28.79 GHVQ01001946.1:275-1108(+)